jgi:hypothetical protein
LNNSYLRAKTAKGIDDGICKVLRDLGNPDPPLNLDEVRDLLNLDLRYYSSGKSSPVQELIHKARLGTHRIAENPMVIWDVIRKLDLKALFLPDRRRILIDETQPKAKWRWSEAHEISHSIIPWHQDLMLADNSLTLAPDCIIQMEAEANYGAGRLVFLQDRFSEEVLASPIDLNGVSRLAKLYSNTITSTLWRVVETLDVPSFGIVCQHPHHRDSKFDPNNPLRYFIRSRKFVEEFSTFSESIALKVFEDYCSWNKAGPLGSRIAILADDNGQEHDFSFESFSNRYEALTLAMWLQKHTVSVAMP